MLEGYSGTVSAVTFLLDRKVLASVSYDSTVKLWEACTGTLLQTHPADAIVNTLSFSNDDVFLHRDRRVIHTGFPSTAYPSGKSIMQAIRLQPVESVAKPESALVSARVWGASTAMCRDAVALG
jgi:hypothetical protein